jgi:hypothetical protein
MIAVNSDAAPVMTSPAQRLAAQRRAQRSEAERGRGSRGLGGAARLAAILNTRKYRIPAEEFI